ncbi:MAG: hypothetical protein N2489_08390 [Clostridia bacterium]|nr:hypothetical protein [Clostridia bacterium]
MQAKINKNLQKIFLEFDKIGKLPKMIIKYGSQLFLGLFALGTALIVFNRLYLGFNLGLQNAAISLVKNSFIILAEAIIGGLLIDYIFKR